jgi:DNA-binding MarR family transcriptional regulator
MLRCQIIDGLRNSAAFQPLGRQLVFTAKALREAFEELLARNNASLGTWIVLNALSEQGSVSQTLVASHAHVEGATITHHVDRLESLGLVRRQIDPADRRVRRIETTAEGKRLHKRLLVETRKFEAKMFDGLNDEDRAALRRMLDRIAANLENG